MVKNTCVCLSNIALVHVYLDIAYMYVEAMQDDEWYYDRVYYWEDVYGFNMTNMKKHVYPEAAVEVFDSSKMVSDRSTFKSLDLAAVSSADLDFESTFTLTASKSATWQCFIVSFDNDFVANCKSVIKLPTGSNVTPTHWKQTGLILQKPFEVKSGSVVTGRIVMTRRARNPREYDVMLHVDSISGDTSFEKFSQLFSVK
jgi:hypothetical protein